MWRDKVRNVYGSVQELEAYDISHAIVTRLGYACCSDLWRDNPLIEGSTNPNDLRCIGVLDEFTENYIKAALWSSTDDKDEPLDANYSLKDIASETLDLMILDCKHFQANEAVWLEGRDDDANGVDFWLTRNGHGSGYWDASEGDFKNVAAPKILTARSKAYGGRSLYIGDDGLIYQGEQ